MSTLSWSSRLSTGSLLTKAGSKMDMATAMAGASQLNPAATAGAMGSLMATAPALRSQKPGGSMKSAHRRPKSRNAKGSEIERT